MYVYFDFECSKCAHIFEYLVDGSDGVPDACPRCSAIDHFKKLPSTFASPKSFIVSYPGSKRLKAGYVHTHARPAEKKASQISMHIPRNTGK